MDLEDRSRSNYLTINGIKEGKNEMDTKWKLDRETSEIWIEQAHQEGEKNYKNKLDILRNYKKLKGINFSLFEDFSKETAGITKEEWKKVLKNQKDGKIFYLQYKTVICKKQNQVC